MIAMRNSDQIHSVKDEFTSFQYSTIPWVRQDCQASVNIDNFNMLQNFKDVELILDLTSYIVDYCTHWATRFKHLINSHIFKQRDLFSGYGSSHNNQ